MPDFLVFASCCYHCCRIASSFLFSHTSRSSPCCRLSYVVNLLYISASRKSLSQCAPLGVSCHCHTSIVIVFSNQGYLTGASIRSRNLARIFHDGRAGGTFLPGGSEAQLLAYSKVERGMSVTTHKYLTSFLVHVSKYSRRRS